MGAGKLVLVAKAKGKGIPRIPKKKDTASFSERVKAVSVRNALTQTIDVATSGTISSSGTFYDLTNIAEGSGYGQRTSDHVIITDVDLRALYYDADDTWNFMRAFIFNYTEGAGGAPVLADIFSATYSRTQPWAHRVPNEVNGPSKWVHMLKQGKLHQLGQSTVDYTSVASGADTSQKRNSPEILKWSSKKGIDIMYDSANNPVKNRLYLLILSDSAAALHPNVDGQVRVTYKCIP